MEYNNTESYTLSNCVKNEECQNSPNLHHQTYRDAVLEIFENIRKDLVHKGNILSLPLDFPIVEMSDEEAYDLNHPLGMAHFESAVTSTAIGTPCITMSINKISIRLFGQPKGQDLDHSTNMLEKNASPNLLRLIPTLLHEFAHVTRELTRTDLELDRKSVKSKMKKMDHEAHDDIFYDHFRAILKAADLLGIYTVPNGPNKYDNRTLRRLDQIDAENGTLALLGTSKNFPDGQIPTKSPSQVEGQSTENSSNTDDLIDRILNLVLINNQGKRKFLQLKYRTLGFLQDAASKKFGKKLKKFSKPDGTIIDEQILASLETDSMIHVS